MKNKKIKYIGLLLLLICLYFGKSLLDTHKWKRGSTEKEKVDIPATTISQKQEDVSQFNRKAKRLIYSRHARCRMDCRHIDEGEVKEVLANGVINERKIEQDSRGKTYPVEEWVNGHHLRIVFAPKGADEIEVVTCIDLNKEWPCNCR